MRVLSLDGGGARGLLTLQVLARIEEAQVTPVGKLFDLIVGSSAGGIIALLLTKPEPMSARGALTLFETLVKDIFTEKPWPAITSLGGLIGPKYDGSALREQLQTWLPESLLLHRPVAVTTYDTQAAKMVFASSWDVPTGLETGALAGQATSAAPTYFPPLDGRWLDGGTVANNPSVVAAMCAKDLVDPVPPLGLLSLGTGIPKHNFTAGAWGLTEWIGKIVDVMLDGEAELQHKLSPYFVSKYLRVQPLLPSDISMDDSSGNTINLLESIGAAAYEAHQAELTEFFATTTTLPGG